jgi:transglutaminase-like putative cysteine protease
MKLERAFVLSVYLLATIAMGALGMAEGTPAVILAAFAFPALAYVRAERLGKRMGRAPTNLLGLLALLFTPIDYAAFSGDVMLAIAHLLMAVQVVKLFGPKRPRDYLQVFAISLMHVGVAAVMTIDLSFSVSFVLYTMVGTWTLVLFCLVRETRRGAPEELGRVRIGRRAPAAAAALTVGMLAMVTLTFLVFPRFSAVLLRIQRQSEPTRVSGFSSEIGLTDISSIKENDAKVMQVIVEERGAGFPVFPRWRGLAFDRYVTGRWSRSWGAAARGSVIRDVPRAQGTAGDARWTLIDGEAPTAGTGERSVYSVTLAPTGADVLFAAPRPHRVAFLSAERPSFLRFTPGDSVRAVGVLAADIRYRVESIPPSLGAAQRAGVVPGGRVGDVDYVTLGGSGVDTDRLRALADQIVDDAGARSPFAHAAALENHLRLGYGYSLDLTPPPSGVDPVEHFLFEAREGHCELFASAFVLMARTLGIPARLVNGFTAGEWNDIGEFWQVRQKHAHAWTEIHLDGVGWIPFDPTPDAGFPDEASGFLTSASRLVDYLRLRWLNHVVGYSLADQMGFADRLRRETRGLGQKSRLFSRDLLQRIPRVGRRAAALGGAVALVLLGLGALAWAAGRRRLAARAAAADPPGSSLYRELRKVLSSLGYEATPSETPRELAKRSRELGAGPGLVVDAFYAMRYGGESLSPDQLAQTRAAISALEALASARRADPDARARRGLIASPKP